MAKKQTTQSSSLIATPFIPVLVANNTSPATDGEPSNSSTQEKYELAVRKQRSGATLKSVKNNRTLPTELLVVAQSGNKRVAVRETKTDHALISFSLVPGQCQVGALVPTPDGYELEGRVTILFRGKARTISGLLSPLINDVDLVLPKGTLKRFSAA